MSVYVFCHFGILCLNKVKQNVAYEHFFGGKSGKHVIFIYFIRQVQFEIQYLLSDNSRIFIKFRWDAFGVHKHHKGMTINNCKSGNFRALIRNILVWATALKVSVQYRGHQESPGVTSKNDILKYICIKVLFSQLKTDAYTHLVYFQII